MGQVDDYILSQIQPGLWAHERICWQGYLYTPKKVNPLGVAGVYVPHLVAATDRRLILIRTTARALSLTSQPKLSNLGVTVWRYDQLQDIQFDKAPGLTSNIMIGLRCHDPLGPFKGRTKRYDIALNGDGLAAQAAFAQQWPTWLKQQIAAGAFPMCAEDVQQVQAHQHAQQMVAAQQQRERLAAAERARKRNAAIGAFAKRNALTIAATFTLLLAVAGGAMAADDYHSISFWTEAATSSEASADAQDEEARQLKREEGSGVDKEELRELRELARKYRNNADEARDDAAARETTSVVWTLATIVLLGIAAGLAVMEAKRRQQRRPAKPAQRSQPRRSGSC